MAKYVQPNFIVDSSAQFKRNVTFDSSVYLRGEVHISNPVASTKSTPPYALVVDSLGADVSIGSKLLGTMAFEASTNYYGKTQVDALLVPINASIVRIDASLNDTIDALTLFPTIAYVDGSLNAKLNLTGGTLSGLLTLGSAGFVLDGQTITGIDTSAEGFGVGSDSHIPTSALVKAAIDAGVSTISANNGLIEQPSGNIQLGGFLTRDTSIDFNGQELYFVNTGVGTGLNALVQQSDNKIKLQQLGTMALGASANYYSRAAIDSSFAAVWLELGYDDTSLNSIWTKLGSVDTSLTNLGTKDANQDVSLNAIWTKLGSVDTSLTNLGTVNANQDTSIHNLDLLTQIQSASIGALTAATTKAWNGLTTTNGSVGLGGTLSIPTTITTDATETLTLAGLQVSSANTPYVFVEDTINSAMKVRTLGTMAWETSINYVGMSYLNASLGTVWSKFANVDTSLTNLGIKDAAIDTSLNGIWTKLGSVDTSLNGIWTKFGYVDTSLHGLDASIVTLNSAIQNLNASSGLYVLKTGDTMTGPLVLTQGGISLTTGDVSIMNGGLYVKNNAHIAGNLIVDGSLYVTNVESIDVSSAFIELNTGMTGAPPSFLQSGIIVNRGSANPYIFIYDEDGQTFRIGIASKNPSDLQWPDASTQAVATRQDVPVGYGVPYWNPTKYWFETSVGFTFTPGVGLHLPLTPAQANNTSVLSISSGLVGVTTLGTMAFEASTNYTWKGLFDSSISAIWTKFGSVDTSLANLGSWIQDLSSNKLDGLASTTGVSGAHAVYSGRANNIAYIKQLKAGVGVTISEDSSILTIAVGGTSGVQKYVGTFDGTAASPFTILATTHTLGTGPFTVSVYESNEQVYTGVNVNGSGDVQLSWGAGSLVDPSCKFIITG